MRKRKRPFPAEVQQAYQALRDFYHRLDSTHSYDLEPLARMRVERKFFQEAVDIIKLVDRATNIEFAEMVRPGVVVKFPFGDD